MKYYIRRDGRVEIIGPEFLRRFGAPEGWTEVTREQAFDVIYYATRIVPDRIQGDAPLLNDEAGGEAS